MVQTTSDTGRQGLRSVEVLEVWSGICCAVTSGKDQEMAHKFGLMYGSLLVCRCESRCVLQRDVVRVLNAVIESIENF